MGVSYATHSMHMLLPHDAGGLGRKGPPTSVHSTLQFGRSQAMAQQMGSCGCMQPQDPGLNKLHVSVCNALGTHPSAIESNVCC